MLSWLGIFLTNGIHQCPPGNKIIHSLSSFDWGDSYGSTEWSSQYSCNYRGINIPWDGMHSIVKLLANRWNNSHWDLQCIVRKIEPIRLWKPCVMHVRGPKIVGRAEQTDQYNIVTPRFSEHRTKGMSGVVGSNVWPVSNFAQKFATTGCNRMCKRTQHATSNDFGSSCMANICVRLHVALVAYSVVIAANWSTPLPFF